MLEAREAQINKSRRARIVRAGVEIVMCSIFCQSWTGLTTSQASNEPEAFRPNPLTTALSLQDQCATGLRVLLKRKKQKARSKEGKPKGTLESERRNAIL